MPPAVAEQYEWWPLICPYSGQTAGRGGFHGESTQHQIGVAIAVCIPCVHNHPAAKGVKFRKVVIAHSPAGVFHPNKAKIRVVLPVREKGNTSEVLVAVTICVENLYSISSWQWVESTLLVFQWSFLAEDVYAVGGLQYGREIGIVACGV